MATLKDVVGKLEENNQKLGNIDTSIDKVEAGILGLFGLQKRAQLDQLEASREAGQSAKNVATLGNEPKGKGAGGDADNDGGGLFSGLSGAASGLIGGLTLSGLLRGLIKRSPFLLATVFGDEMASVLEGLGLEKEIAGSIGRGIQAAGIAGIISPRLAPIAGLLGVIIDDETAKELKAIKDDFVKNFDIEGFKNSLNTALEPLNGIFDELGFDFEINIPSFQTILDWMRRNLIEGVQGLSNILTGEGSLEDLGNAAGVLGAIAFAFAPFRTIAVASKIPGVAFLLGKKLYNAVKTLGGLALGLGDAAASLPLKQSGGTSLAYKAGQQVGKLGPVLAFAGRTLLSMTPAGLVLAGAATLGYFAGEMFKETEAYAMLKKKSDEMLASMPLGADTDESAMLGDSNRSPANQSRSDDSAIRQNYLNMMAAAKAAGIVELYNRYAEALARLDAKRKAFDKPNPGQAAQNAFNDYNASQAMSGRGGGGNSFVDASTTNVGQSTTALVGSGTNSFDMNNPVVRKAVENMFTL